MRAIQDFHRRFRTNDDCLQHIFALRFSDVQCPKCKRCNAYHRHPAKQCYTCNCGQHQLFPRSGTLFEKSPLSLTKWFYAIFLMCGHPHGVSAKKLERSLQVTYSTAWRMARKIRSEMTKKEKGTGAYIFESLLATICEREKQVGNVL